MTVVRDDFWASTSNKQLNFVQHMQDPAEDRRPCAVVVPDNVLFEGGAGETIRRKLLHECDVHTLLRLPTGIFYAQGVKANVLFFDRKPASETPWTQGAVDLRPAHQPALHAQEEPADPSRPRRLRRLLPARRDRQREETEQFKRFTYDELIARDKASLDIFWLRDESLEDTDNLPAPGVIAAEIVEDLRSALEEFGALAESLADVGVEIEEGEDLMPLYEVTDEELVPFRRISSGSDLYEREIEDLMWDDATSRPSPATRCFESAVSRRSQPGGGQTSSRWTGTVEYM